MNEKATPEMYVAGVEALRSEASAKRKADTSAALRETGETVDGLPVLEVATDSGSPAVLRLTETMCACGEYLGTQQFVYWKKSHGYLHVACLDLASSGYKPGESQGGLFA